MFTLISSLFSTATSKISTYLYLITFTAVLLLVLGLVYEVHYYKGEYETTLASQATLKQQYSQLESDLKKSNEGVDALKKESDDRLKAAREALTKAQLETKIVRKKADSLLQAIPSSPDSCVASKDLFKSYLSGDLQK
jgi:Tfp pilus assembly protein PilN